SRRPFGAAHRECLLGICERDRAGYLARQRMGERPVLAAWREAELDRRGRGYERHGLWMLRDLAQFCPGQPIAPRLRQTFVIEDVASRVDYRVLKDGRTPDPLCRILGRFRVQPGQEDH